MHIGLCVACLPGSRNSLSITIRQFEEKKSVANIVELFTQIRETLRDEGRSWGIAKTPIFTNRMG
jgi:hypothetical protein